MPPTSQVYSAATAVEIDLTIKNYRCFSDEHPARITLRPGAISFVGKNNSGKSTLLPFFFELRNLFQVMSSPGQVHETILKNRRSFSFPTQQVPYPNAVFCDLNNRDLTISLAYRDGAGWDTRLVPSRVDIRIPRSTSDWWPAETLPPAKAEAMASQWMAFNHVRAALALIGWLAALKALSLPG